MRGCLCLSHPINSEILVKFLFPSFLRLCSLQSALPETCSPESAGWDLSALAALLIPLPTMVPPTGYIRWDTPPFPSLSLTYSKHPLVSLLFWRLIQLLWQRQISNTSSSGMWITETAAGTRHSLLNPCKQLLCCTEGIQITRHKVLHSVSHKELQKAVKLPNVLFPTYLAVDTTNPWYAVDCNSLKMGWSACPAGHRAQHFTHSHPHPLQAPLLIKKKFKSTIYVRGITSLLQAK